MSDRYDDTDAGKRGWITDVRESRQRALEFLDECAHQSIPNWQSINVSQEVMALHTAILNYHAHLAPKATDVELPDGFEPKKGVDESFQGWNEQLTTVEVPESGSYECGRTNRWGEFNLQSALQHVDMVEKSVNCATLSREWRVNNEIHLELAFDEGEVVVTRRLTAYLPPGAAGLVFSQLDMIIEQIGWTPDAAEIGVHSEPAL